MHYVCTLGFFLGLKTFGAPVSLTVANSAEVPCIFNSLLIPSWHLSRTFPFKGSSSSIKELQDNDGWKLPELKMLSGIVLWSLVLARSFSI